MAVFSETVGCIFTQLHTALDRTQEHLFTNGEVLGYKIVGGDNEQPLNTEPHWGNYPKHTNWNFFTVSHRGLLRGIICEERILKSYIVSKIIPQKCQL